ncbi:MAG: ribosome maturation factor RimP [gamma proteobacterium symbiont of Bathyaustriella thionipta]|nr:ribosome maturation factor RimP [gamma proteobacterium symbiont of Bathyaustriella thionipta]MCU7949937.1 ribosome maturation factor RimP [gamma proteobacterium symbiont of Bathyaustriella thionipta]MCU7954711.1 ribosome maturation factor RimP [gamma proteobacterium symbiont of Bathyaustriella thionipta]MCU7956504.1 ribosome maturation factor RimP [gamma proteobacterium symbiont of Bathyaustriella thionipta]MCU7966585.1 ribosome maturation factor RimP [gamma proteobacterium symbiont of Bathy
MAVKTQELEDLLEPVVTSMDYEFVGLEFLSQGRHSILRIYIDTERGVGVGVDDCADVSRQLSAVLDVEDPIASEYSLEISSPGLNRPLFKLNQYAQFIGEEVKFKTIRPQLENGQRKFKGIISAVENDNIIFEIEDQMLTVAFADIDSANIIAKF